jgi:hypothetical protein
VIRAWPSSTTTMPFGCSDRMAVCSPAEIAETLALRVGQLDDRVTRMRAGLKWRSPPPASARYGSTSPRRIA